MRVFRYDDRAFALGQVLHPWGDHFATLAAGNQSAERALRSYDASSSEVRSNSIYAWKDREFAERIWPRSKKAYLYELEVEDDHVRHIGDVNCITALMEAIATAGPVEDHIACYWSGHAQPGAEWTAGRIEVLVSEAEVISRLRP